MTPPSGPAPSAASVPRGCGGDRCASGRDAWPLHHVHHDGVFCRLCSSCVLLYHPTAYCSACLLLVAHEPVGDPSIDRALAPPGPTVACSDCGLSVAHVSCLQGVDAAAFVCAPCTDANEGRPFTFTPPVEAGRPRVFDERSVRVLLVAARLANDSVQRAAAAASEQAERSVARAAATRKSAREALDTAFRALEAEAMEANKLPAALAQHQKPPPALSQQHPPPPALAQQPPPKKKTPKSEANRDRDKLLKLNAMQQPALAFAAAAAAAASSMPLPTPPSTSMPLPTPKEENMQDAQGSAASAPREGRPHLFGTLQP